VLLLLATTTILLKVFSDEAQRDKTTRKHSGDQRDYSDKRTTILEEEYVGESIYGEGVGISIMCDHQCVLRRQSRRTKVTRTKTEMFRL
jgi:hypothetical protein